METLAALVVFSLVTLGIMPLLTFSIQGAGSSRAATVAKNAAVKAMERARGLPFHVSYPAERNRVDVLDMFLPRYVPGGRSVTVCDATTVTDPACPKTIPSGVRLTTTASFVQPTTTNPQTFTVVVPPSSYRWDSTTGADFPSTQLVQLVVRADWSYAGRTRNYELTTLLGNRKFDVVGPPQPPGATPSPSAPTANLKVRAVARQEYTLQVITGYRGADEEGGTELRSTAGATSSEVEVGIATLASQSTRAADFRLVEEPTDLRPYAIDLAEMTGAIYVDQTPPDILFSGSQRRSQTLRHPRLGLDIGFMGETFAGGYVRAGVELPNVFGIFEGDVNSRTATEFWVDNQVPGTSGLRLDSRKPMVEATERDPRNEGADDLWGGSQANVTALTASNRHAEAVARAEIWSLKILPTTFAPLGVVQVEDLFARVQCTSTANAGTAVASASWSGILRYWNDPTNNGVAGGSYQSLTLSGTTGSDPLVAIKASNPLVYDGATPSADIYLFSDPAAGRAGYLTEWSSLRAVPAGIDAAGRVATASIDTAIRIDTVPTNPAVPDSAINIGMANLSCKSEDYR